MDFDARTVVLLIMLIAGGLALLISVSVAGYPDSSRRPLLHWSRALALQSVGWLLFGLRGQIDDNFSVVVANTLLALAFVEALRALRGFFGQTEVRVFDRVFVLAIILAALFFLHVVPSVTWRIATISMLFAVMFAHCAQIVIHYSLRPMPRSHWVVSIVYLILVGVLTLRCAREFLIDRPLTDVLALDFFTTITFASAGFSSVVTTFGFILMVNERLHAELTRQAARDPLTGTYNRRTMAELAARGIAQARRSGTGFGLLHIDADHFKRINDTLGHDAGDEALVGLVASMRAATRAEDLLGRVGGEEFVVLLPDVDAAQAAAAGERLRAAVEQTPIIVDGRAWPLRVSVGVATLRDGEDFAGLLRRADQSMYAAKHAGRNRVMLAPQSDAPAFTAS